MNSQNIYKYFKIFTNIVFLNGLALHMHRCSTEIELQSRAINNLVVTLIKLFALY